MFRILLVVILTSSFWLIRAQEASPHLAITGEAEITVPADYIRISVNLSEESSDLQELQKTLTERAAQVLAFLNKASGVGEIRSDQIYLHKTYRKDTPKRYSGTQNISFSFRDLSNYQALAWQLTELPISGYRISEKVLLAETERRKGLMARAFADAQNRAQALAAAAGLSLGNIQHIHYNTGQATPGRPYLRSTVRESGPDAGSLLQLTMRERVQVQFLLEEG